MSKKMFKGQQIKNKSGLITLLSGVAVLALVAAAWLAPASSARASLPPNCTPPGVSLITDAGGDTGTGSVPTVPGTPAQDITEVLIAEPFQADGVNRLSVTMRVADLTALPASGIWRVFFTVGSTVYFVGAFNDPVNGLQFNYGTSGTITTTVGAADAGAVSVADKTITVLIANSKVGNPAAGATLVGIYGRTQTLVGAAGTGATPTHDLAPNAAPTSGTATYTLIGNAACATATPTPTPTATPTATPTPTPAPSGAPRFFNYASPPGIADDAGEPTLGVNWNTEKTFSNSNGPIPNGGTVMFFGGFLPYASRVTFDDSTSPATATWEQAPVVLPTLPRAFGDPILFTDRETGRTFVSQLMGLTPLGSTMEYTDDDGRTFQPSEGSGLPSNIDHQTIGGGPYHAPLPNGVNPIYKNAVYYCSQSVAEAACSLSVDGGRTFGPMIPMYTSADCAGLHGHVKVGPDGTVYVPNKGCGDISDPLFHSNGRHAVIVSEDNGFTWSIRQIPTADTASDRDPSVAVADDSNTIYFAYKAKNGHSRVAVSHDKGRTWVSDTDVGALAGVQNSLFQAAVAGDRDRAAVAYFGTTTGGDNYDQPGFPGVWHLYISTTYDGGRTWTTQNVTPGDPIQRGGICGDGECRNLLDFFDAVIDKQGRVLVAWDDGCITPTCINGGPNDFTAKGVITRQTGGKRMYARHDPVEPALPGAPLVSGGVNEARTAVSLSWPVPDSGGSTITAYKVYRRFGAAGSFSPLATVNETRYTDTAILSGTQIFYRVTAVNAVGEGPYAKDFLASDFVPEPTACELPGIPAVNDVNTDGSDSDSGQNTPLDPSVNVRKLYVAEPFTGAGVNQLTFTLQVAPSGASAPPPSSQWYIIWKRQTLAADGSDRMYVAMKTDVNGVASFEFGNFGPPIPTDPFNPQIPPPNANTPTRLGDVDFGSYTAATGEIVIKLSTAKAENVQPGQSLADLNVRTFLARPDPGQRSQNNASDITANGVYTVVGNASCRVNQAPTASLSASPTSGVAPLTVSFDASASRDPDAGDSVASYVFTFGDGTPDVTQSTPTVTHTYAQAGGYFATLRVRDQSGTESLNVASVAITVSEPPPPPTTETIEDDDPRIAYSGGWHLVSYSGASAGHFRYHSGKSPGHTAALDFDVPAGKAGAIAYHFARSPKGGKADVYLDGVFKETVSFVGSVGSTQRPEFSPAFRLSYNGLAAGAHRLELRNMSDVVYIDRFVLETAVSSAQPASGPGVTSNRSGSAELGQAASSGYQAPSNAQGLSLVVEASLDVPFQVTLVDASGLTLQTMTASKGMAALDVPATAGGTYVVRVVNLSLGPLQFTTTITPTVAR